MKYLVIATPIAPVLERSTLDTLATWLKDRQRQGLITEAWGLVGGGGISIMEADDPEALHQMTALCPIGAYLSFEFRPLIDLDRTLELGSSLL